MKLEEAILQASKDNETIVKHAGQLLSQGILHYGQLLIQIGRCGSPEKVPDSFIQAAEITYTQLLMLAAQIMRIGVAIGLRASEYETETTGANDISKEAESIGLDVIAKAMQRNN